MNHPRPKRLIINHGLKHKLDSRVRPNSGGRVPPDLQPTSPPTLCVPDRAAAADLHQETQFLQIGKYVISQVSSASPWETCTAVDKTTGEEYLCKVMPLSKYRQALVPYLLTDGHPHIVSIWEIILGQSNVYVLFQRAYGDLHSYIREKKKLGQAEARELARQVTAAVAYCHESGVLLRSLKLRKFIFKNPERTQLLMDGLDDAVVLDDADASDVLTDKCVCLAYVSPEILSSSDGYSGKRMDIWCLGIMIYTILVGRYPFHDREPLALFEEIKRGIYKIPDTLPVRAKCLIRSLLCHEPGERLSAAEALEHPWFTRSILMEQSSRQNKTWRSVDQIVPVRIFQPDTLLESFH